MSDIQLDSLLATASSPFFVLKWAKPDFPDSMKILVGDLLFFDVCLFSTRLSYRKGGTMLTLISCKFTTEST